MNLETLTPTELLRMAAIGVGATVVLDAWLLLLRRLGRPTMDFALLGRWVGHLLRGTWRHASIARAASLPGEVALGWIAHYAVGIAFAAVLVRVCGVQWLARPTPGPALLFGVLTVAVPFLVMQPAMGLGVAAARTAAPMQNRLRSLANHAVFGFGLYLAAMASAWIPPHNATAGAFMPGDTTTARMSCPNLAPESRELRRGQGLPSRETAIGVTP